ncbi:hypothetical protein MKW98_002188 [Papaver atlanticum]|uniref:Uncharacterized protein n=1 Tax=Papaver atlanticum TaxID=357466 RepID=A0AAD4RUB9_9MAGN|nr:hypothetical protein MKW98_002188 [Papaver atlanticum]
MGNCLITQVTESVEVMKTDGSVLEYKTPLRVHEVLSEFAGHAISDTPPVHHHLWPHAEMFSGSLYYLLPPALLLPSSSSFSGYSDTEKKLHGSINPRNKHRTRTSTNVARIKVVITKRELKEMLSKKEIVSSSFQEIISQNHNKETSKQDSYTVDDAENCKEWRPILVRIPE